MQSTLGRRLTLEHAARALASGETHAAIAVELGVSERTVRRYAAALRKPVRGRTRLSGVKGARRAK